MTEDIPVEPIEPVDDSPPEPEEKSSGVVETLDKAEKAADRLEAANKELKGLLEKQAAMKLERTMGGEATAGSKKMSKEERAIAEAKKILVGTGYEDLLD